MSDPLLPLIKKVKFYHVSLWPWLFVYSYLIRWKWVTVTRDNHRRARLGAVPMELCKASAEKEENQRKSGAGLSLPLSYWAGSPRFHRRWCKETAAVRRPCLEVSRTPPCLPAQDLDDSKILWNCCGYLCLSRKLKFGIFFITFLITFKQEGWRQKGGAWGINLVQLHPDNCVHKHKLGIEMQAFENTKEKKSGSTLDTIGKESHCFWSTLFLHLFKVRATRLFSTFSARANVPSGNAGTQSYFKVHLTPRDECAPLSSSHLFFSELFLYLLSPETKLICHPV